MEPGPAGEAEGTVADCGLSLEGCSSCDRSWSDSSHRGRRQRRRARRHPWARGSQLVVAPPGKGSLRHFPDLPFSGLHLGMHVCSCGGDGSEPQGSYSWLEQPEVNGSDSVQWAVQFFSFLATPFASPGPLLPPGFRSGFPYLIQLCKHSLLCVLRSRASLLDLCRFFFQHPPPPGFALLSAFGSKARHSETLLVAFVAALLFLIL